jgi:hypothetical protein
MTKEEFDNLKAGDVIYWAGFIQPNGFILEVMSVGRGYIKVKHDKFDGKDTMTSTLNKCWANRLFISAFDALVKAAGGRIANGGR